MRVLTFCKASQQNSTVKDKISEAGEGRTRQGEATKQWVGKENRTEGEISLLYAVGG